MYNLSFEGFWFLNVATHNRFTKVLQEDGLQSGHFVTKILKQVILFTIQNWMFIIGFIYMVFISKSWLLLQFPQTKTQFLWYFIFFFETPLLSGHEVGPILPLVLQLCGSQGSRGGLWTQKPGDFLVISLKAMDFWSSGVPGVLAQPFSMRRMVYCQGWRLRILVDHSGSDCHLVGGFQCLLFHLPGRMLSELQKIARRHPDNAAHNGLFFHLI